MKNCLILNRTKNGKPTKFWYNMKNCLILNRTKNGKPTTHKYEIIF